MKLVVATVVIIFLLVSWASVSSLRTSGATQPGILLRLSDNGLQYAAKKIMEFVDSKIDPGMRLSDLKGTFQPSVGSVDYLMTDMRTWNFNWDEVSGSVIPGVGVGVTFRKISVKIDGRFHISYSVMALPSTNKGTFSLTVSDVSLSVNATAGMGATGLPTIDLSDCSAEIGNMGLDFKAESLNWVLKYFSDNIKAALKPALTSAICKAVASGRDMVLPQITNHIKPCLDRSCFFLIDLHFVSPPVFGQGFVEVAFRGDIFWRSDPKRAPFKAVAFQRMAVSPKMADIYVNAYVLNSLLYALYQNDLLSCVFTKNELPVDYRYVMSTSCTSGFCVGKVLPDVSSLYPDATVELDIIATKLPSIDIFDNDLFTLTFGGNISVRVRNSTGSKKTFGVLSVEGFVTASALLTSDGAFVFIIKQIGLSNASISENEAQQSERKDLTDDLRSSATNYLLPKLNEFGQKGFSVLRVGKLRASSPSLRVIQNAFVLMTDVTYSNVTIARILRAMSSD